MKNPQSKLHAILFLLGGVLMVASVGCYVLLFQQRITCWTFLVGAVLFTTMQAMQTYEGSNFTITRLRRIMAFADICFLLSGLLMVDTTYGFLASVFNNYIDYYNYVYNKWVLLLLIAAILELYSSHRISSELKTERN